MHLLTNFGLNIIVNSYCQEKVELKEVEVNTTLKEAPHDPGSTFQTKQFVRASI